MRDLLQILAIVAVATLAVASPSVPQASAAANDDYKLGISHYKQKRWPLAVEYLGKFLKAAPGDPKAASARLLLGVSLTHRKQYALARTELKRFLKLHPKDRNRPEAAFRIGECSYLLGELKSAEIELASYLASAPKHNLREWGQFYLADARRRQKKYTAAETVYRQALKEFPNGSLVNEIKFGLASCCQQSKKTSDARKLYLELSLSKNPGHAEKALSQLGSIEFEAGRFSEAARAWNQLDRRFPKSPLAAAARLNAGYAHFELKQYPEAISRFQAARSDAAQAAVADYWRGVCLKSLDRSDDAIRAFRQSERGRPDRLLQRDIQFQWADTDFQAGNYSAAGIRFQAVVDGWPKHAEADQSLLFATEAALLMARQATTPLARRSELDRAGKLVARFAGEYPRSRLAIRHALQAGRLQLARGGKADLKAAINTFRGVLAKSSTPKDLNRSRYQLARAAGRLNDHPLVIQTLTPLLATIRKSKGATEFDDALVLAASSFLARNQVVSAADAAADYLRRHPKGGLAGQALATSAEAEQRRGKLAASDQALTRLANSFSTSPLYPQAVHRLAELAFDAKDFRRSDRMFAMLVGLGPKSTYHAAGLSGRGWSLFETKKYAEAAESFRKLVEQHPRDELAAEAAFKSAESYEKGGKRDAAAKAFQLASRGYGKSPFAFLASRRAARLLAGQNKIAQAHAAYDELLKRFPKAADRDALLYEWAGMHADADDFSKADVIYRRLVRETPQSPLVDNARFSLAESSLIAGRLDEAAKVFTELAADKKADQDIQEDALYRLVLISADQDRWDAVRQQARGLLTRYPKSRHLIQARFQLGQACLNLKDYPAARTELTAVLARREDPRIAAEPWFDLTWVLLADTHFRLQAYDEVVRTVSEFRRVDPKSAVLYKAEEVLGRSLIKKARPDFLEARAAFRRAINSATGQKTETAARSHLQLADSFFLQKKFAEAKKEFLAVHILYKFPAIQAPALFQAGACQEKLKEWRGAVRTYEQLLKEFPRSAHAAEARKRLLAVRRLATP